MTKRCKTLPLIILFAQCNKMRVFETGLSVNERAAVGVGHAAARIAHNGVSGGGVPFHGAAKPWVDVSLGVGDHAELDRTSRRDFLGDVDLGQVFIDLFRTVRAAGDGGDSGFGKRAALDRLCHACRVL